MRMIDELDTEETAECLDLTEANVKVRLHRARSLLKQRIDEQIGAGVRQIYQFDGDRCDRIVKAVIARLSRRFGISNAPCRSQPNTNGKQSHA
jgi:RNA polymerase sigma-70 factor (ECF subfamily)